MIVSGCSGQNPVDNPSAPSDPAGEPQPDPEEEARKRQEEWERRNEELKEELGKYYVPLPPLDQPENPPQKVRGLYCTGHTVGYPPRYDYILDLLDKTELNALVIDVMDDSGKMSYYSEIEAVQELQAVYDPPPITDIRATLEELHSRGIYTIARIVVFKDMHMGTARPEWCIPFKSGGVYRDSGGFSYGNPFNEEIWDYKLAIAKEAALLGFKEIQFDYIRFPDNAAYMEEVADYPGRNGRPKAEAIAGFVKRAREELAPYNVHVSHDPFGVIVSSWGDNDDIGQIWEVFAANSDYVYPMIYPSHYGVNQGWFGLRAPDTDPVTVVTGALTDAIKRSATLKNPAVIRPWLQAFTASYLGGGNYIPYGAAEIRQQIDAALALGIDEYVLWDPANSNYPTAAFFTAAEADRRAAERAAQRESKGQDHLNRTARQAVEIFLEAIKEGDWREAFALHRTGREGSYEEGNRYRAWFNENKGKPSTWTITGTAEAGGTMLVNLDLVISSGGEEHRLEGEQWAVVMENSVWRISPSNRFVELWEGTELEERG